MCYTGRDEERNTGTNAPLADQFVQQEHEVRTGKELRHDDEVGPTQAVGVDEPLAGVKEPVGLRNGLDGNHDENEEFLHTLVHRLVFGVAEVETNDLGTGKQLHDDRTRNDGTDAQVHDGTRSTGHDRAETAEQVKRLSGQTEQHDVGHGEVDDEHERGGPHLLVEADVAFGLGDGGVDVHEAAQGVETAALIAAPHETREDGGSSESKQENAHEEEANAFVVATPSTGAYVPNSDGAEDQPTGQFSVAPDKGHVLETGWEVLLETQHAVSDVGHRKH